MKRQTTPGKSYKRRIRPIRPIYPLVVLFVVLLVGSLPGSALAQYRGGREPPEEDFLGRKGVLFASTGGFYAQPLREFKNPNQGAAAHTFGWKVSIGAWITQHITTEFEWGLFNNDRNSDIHPFSGKHYDFISWMGYESTFWQVVFRYHLRVEKRVIPYLTIGGGRVGTSFLLDSEAYGYTQQVNLSSGTASAFSYGLGANVVVVKHIVLGIECRSMEWTTRSVIPTTCMWGIFRFGLHMSWHF